MVGFWVVVPKARFLTPKALEALRSLWNFRPSRHALCGQRGGCREEVWGVDFTKAGRLAARACLLRVVSSYPQYSPSSWGCACRPEETDWDDPERWDWEEEVGGKGSGWGTSARGGFMLFYF